MPDKKVYITLFIILIVFFFVMFGLFGVRNIQENEFDATIVVGEDTTWVLHNRRWIYLRKSDSRIRVGGEDFHVYDNNEELGVYELKYNQKWKVRDKNKQEVEVSDNLLAYRANYQMKVLSYKESQVSDMTYVKKVLEDNQLSVNNKFTSLYKIKVDFDNDSKVEEFYVISNAFPLDFEPDETFSIAFMVKENQIYYLYTDISKFNSLNACKPYYRSFIDIDYDNHYEVILSCGRFSATNRVDMLYEFENNQFKLLISNQ